MPQRDRHGTDDRQLRQQADEPAMLAEFVLAVLVTQADVVRRLLGTAQLNLRQFAWALPAIALLALWELGKLLARRSQAGWPLATD
jgi:hypothetical protein